MSWTDEGADPELEALGIGGVQDEVGPRNGRSVLELWEGRELEDDGVLYVVDIGEGYAVGAQEDYSDAVDEAEAHKQNEGTTDLSIVKYERVPHGLKLVVLAHFEYRGQGPRSRELAESGISGPRLSEGYDVSSALAPYLSDETLSSDPKKPWEERGVVWKWSMYEDEDYEDWGSEQRDSYRQERLYEARPKEPLHMDEEAVEALRLLGLEVPYLQEGLRLFFRTTDPAYYRETVEEGTLLGGSWLAASIRPEDAPWDESLGDPTSGEYLVQVEVVQAVPTKESVEVPWVPPDGEKGYKISELSMVLGVELDPKKGSVDGEEVGEKIKEYHRELSVLVVRTGPEPDRAVVFFFPEHRSTELRVVGIEEVTSWAPDLRLPTSDPED